MPSMNPVVEIPIPFSGIQPSKHPSQLGPNELIGCQNMLIEDGRLKTRPPIARANTYDAVQPLPDNDMIEGITAAYTSNDEKVILIASAGTPTGTIRYYNNNDTTGNWEPVDTTFTMSASGYAFTFVTFETQIGTSDYRKYLFFCNGNEPLSYWNGEYTASSVTVATTATEIKPFTMDVINDRLVCANFPSSASYLMISDYLDPTSFPGVNDRNFGETPGEVTCVKQLGLLRGVVYKSDAIFVMSPTGDVYPFQFEAKYRDIPGPVSPQSVVTLPNGSHLFLASDGGAYVFDGVSLTEVNPAVKVYIRNRWDQKYAYRCHVSYDRRQQMIFMFYVPAGSALPQGCLALQYPDFSLWPMYYNIPVMASCRATQEKGLRIGDLKNITIGSLAGTQLGDMNQEQDVFLLAMHDNRTTTGHSFVGFVDYGRGNAQHTLIDDFDYDSTATTITTIVAYFETPLIGAEAKQDNKVVLEVEPLISPVVNTANVDITVNVHETFDNRPVASVDGYITFSYTPTSERKAFGVRKRGRAFSVRCASPVDTSARPLTFETCEAFEYGGSLVYVGTGGRR